MDRFKFRVWKQDNWGYNIKNEFVKQKPHYEYFELNNNIVLHKNDITEQSAGKKDVNGKLIYEGDIVEATPLPEKCLVVWSDEEVGFTLKSLKDNIYYSFYCYDKFAVIGNIHENKDLL